LSLLWLCQTWWWRREGNKESVSCSEGGNLAVDFEVDEDFGFYQNIRRPQVYGIGTIHIRLAFVSLWRSGLYDERNALLFVCSKKDTYSPALVALLKGTLAGSKRRARLPPQIQLTTNSEVKFSVRLCTQLQSLASNRTCTEVQNLGGASNRE
jgi:hypothetical protein